MTEFTAFDHACMAQALRIAARGRYSCWPNPMVGCVIVSDGEVVGQGWHIRTGEGHAEVNALADAGTDANGATAYVTLEPCSFHGRTPPCAEALIKAGVSSVVIAALDPNPRVYRNGVSALEQAGINVRTGCMAQASENLIEGYISRQRHGRPFVRLKLAVSLDGAIAMSSGESQWITGPEARADVQRLRARSGAILTGIGTVLADDPSLTVRDESLDIPQQPLRVVVDSGLRTPASAKLLRDDGRALVYSLQEDAVLPNADTVCVDETDGQVCLETVLNDLGEREINELLVEAGPTLAGQLLSMKLVDELVIYQAPHIMGSETRSMVRTPAWTRLADRMELDITDIRKTGDDLRISARPRQ